MKKQGLFTVIVLASAVVTAVAAEAQSPVDPALPVYTRVEGLKGRIALVGSDTISQLSAVWGDSFKKLYPDVDVQVEVKGSVNAVSSVISGEATFGLLSRQITEEEVKAFQAKFGYPPTVLVPSLEPIAIYVNKNNPIKSLTLTQLDAIFSSTLKRGAPKTVTTWGDLGLAGQWATQPIICQGRNDKTGSQVFFQTAILGNGEFRQDIVHNASNQDLVKAIASDPRAIGFAGAIHATPDVRAVPLAWKEGEQAIALHDAHYPLVRPLQIIVNKDPHKPLPELEREFLKFVFSQRGQQDVIIGGFAPIPARPAQIALDAIGQSILH